MSTAAFTAVDKVKLPRLLLGAALGVVAALSAVSVADAQAVTVRTIAGSGRAGFEDGPALAATFMLPMGMAFDREGNLYIADGAAQRVRVMDRNGNVHTVAGGGPAVDSGFWVPGGYADGAGPQARFNRPAGIAFGPDGDLYIADSFNHCIRRMTPSGDVTTFAGSPSSAGMADGPRQTATFQRPMGLAFDKIGNLYVADPLTQVRKVDPAGVVSYIQVGNQPTNVAVFDGAAGPTLFVAGFEGLILRTPDAKIERFSPFETHLDGDRFLQGGRALGHPFGVAALDDHTVVFTDARSNTVRYLDTRYGQERILAGAPNEDASADTGGYVDGTGPLARLSGPLGIAMRADGALVVADAGNRRIRTLTPPDRREAIPLSVDLLGVARGFSPQDFKIALAGDSFVWYNTDWDTSIEGRLQHLIGSNAEFPSSTSVRVIPVWGMGSLDATDQYLKIVMDTGLFNTLLLNINAIDIAGSFGIKLADVSSNAVKWQDPLTQDLRILKGQAAAAGVPLAIVIEPLPNQLSWQESAWYELTSKPAPLDLTFKGLLRSAIRKSGVPVIDLWPAFQADLASPSHRALYATEDPHFSVHGREVAAAEIAKALLKMRPWKSR
ncbi:MAG: hypothetical protein DLM50_02010 [Candidatus Meridianibacter frigidus]|nr:MAG: hypothetical protein DLM50_02010 [Candidatus Eremiobacteraeota bacterium]